MHGTDSAVHSLLWLMHAEHLLCAQHQAKCSRCWWLKHEKDPPCLPSRSFHSSVPVPGNFNAAVLGLAYGLTHTFQLFLVRSGSAPWSLLTCGFSPYININNYNHHSFLQMKWDSKIFRTCYSIVNKRVIFEVKLPNSFKCSSKI